MRCGACSYDTDTYFLKTAMMVREEDKITKPFIKIQLGSNEIPPIYACPKCGTLKIEVQSN